MRRWTLTTLMAGSLLLGGAPAQAAPVDAGHEIPRPAGTVAQFKVDLDSEGPTTFVLSRVDGIYGLQAWRYSRALDSMSKVTELQAALDAIVADKKTINEAQVRAALASLQLIDYSVVYHRSGNPQFDTIDHAQGKLVGYFNAEGQPVRQSRGQPAFAYKKTFQEKDGRFQAGDAHDAQDGNQHAEHGHGGDQAQLDGEFGEHKFSLIDTLNQDAYPCGSAGFTT